ncbi:hypothetical protein M3Y96_01021700 [Aphelenchoides besseyi]|nr:hypothetical protein M3Y96_01021700 [Aphelenchoides besseyi]
MSGRLCVFLVFFCIENVFGSPKILNAGDNRFPLHADYIHRWNGSNLETRLVANVISFIVIRNAVPRIQAFNLTIQSTFCLNDLNLIIIEIGNCTNRFFFSSSDGKCEDDGTLSVNSIKFDLENPSYLWSVSLAKCSDADWIDNSEIQSGTWRNFVTYRTNMSNVGNAVAMSADGYAYSNDHIDLFAFIVLCILTAITSVLIGLSIFAVFKPDLFTQQKKHEEPSTTEPNPQTAGNTTQ